ncbi:MAG: hypothetical protein J2P23_07780 [Microlunatus sp.]|nr:hypothetical protein [Microlunatus sp.]
MISVTAVAILLALIVAFLIKSRLLRLSGAIVCILLGLVLGSTAVGGPVKHVLSGAGSSLWSQVKRL